MRHLQHQSQILSILLNSDRLESKISVKLDKLSYGLITTKYHSSVIF